MDVVMDRSKDANPIIVIPGVAGTSLADANSGKNAFGSFGFHSYWPSTEKDNKLLALPLTNNQKQNKVIPTSVLDEFRINLFPFPVFNVSVYSTIVKSLAKSGYQTAKGDESISRYKSKRNTPIFEFAYDWRRSNADSAIELSKFIQEKIYRAESQNIYKKEQKFDILCHSMGCLVARYYLRYGDQGLGTSEEAPALDWRGSKNIENVIMVAPPNKGSIDALSDLVNGYYLHKPIKWLKYPSAVLGTMPSLYELLPRDDIAEAIDHKGREIDLMDPILWQSMSWGLLNPNQANILKQISPDDTTSDERYALASDLQRKLLQRAKLFHSRLDSKSTPPGNLNFYLFAGTGQPTESKVRVDLNDKSLSTNNVRSGDGEVLRASAYAIQDALKPYKGPIIEWRNAIFFFSSHIEMVQNNDFFVNLYDILMWREVL